MTIDTLDDECNFRMTVPLRNFDVECAGRGGDLSLVDFLGQTTNNYFIFPNVAVTLFKRFVLFLSITPKSSNESLVRAWGVKHNFSSEHDGPIRSGDNNAADIRDYNAVIAGIEEDWLARKEYSGGLESLRMLEGITRDYDRKLILVAVSKICYLHTSVAYCVSQRPTNDDDDVPLLSLFLRR